MTEEDDNKFDFELVSPERRLLSHRALMVVVPGGEGDFAVLPKHAALLSSIRPGLLRVFREDENEPFDVYLSGGFADVTPTSCTVLAETAIRVSDLDREELEKDLASLNEDLEMAKTDLDKLRVQRKIDIVLSKIAVVDQVDDLEKSA